MGTEPGLTAQLDLKKNRPVRAAWKMPGSWGQKAGDARQRARSKQFPKLLRASEEAWAAEGQQAEASRQIRKWKARLPKSGASGALMCKVSEPYRRSGSTSCPEKGMLFLDLQSKFHPV